MSRIDTMLSEAAVTRFSFYASWGILLVLFVCAYVQGPDFASTKESSTVFGCAIGVAAFFSWLAVEDDEDDDEDEDWEEPAPAEDTGKEKVS